MNEPEPEAKGERTGAERRSRRCSVPWRARVVRIILNNAHSIYLIVKILEALKRLFLS